MEGMQEPRRAVRVLVGIRECRQGHRNLCRCSGVRHYHLADDSPDGTFNASGWKLLVTAFGFKIPEDARAYKGSPIDILEPLARAKVPLLHVVGDADDVVPVARNTAVLAERYKALGGEITVIHKPGVGHVHGLDDPTPIIQFLLRNTILPERSLTGV